MLVLGRHDFSSKRKCYTLRNLHNKIKNTWYIECSKAQLFGIYSTLLKKKLVALMSFYNIHHQRQLAKNLIRKKLYLIALISLRSETLAIFGIRIIVKFGGVTHQIKPGKA